MKKQIYSAVKIVSFVLCLFIISSCKKEKEAEPPEITFKEGTNYLSGITVLVSPNTIYKVGVIGDKTKVKMRVFRVLYSVDASNYSTEFTYTLKENEKDHFEQDYEITTQSDNGTERYKFTIEDIDGNTAEKIISLSVQ